MPISRAATSWSCASGSPTSDERAFEELFRTPRPRSTGATSTRPSSDRSRRVSPARLPAQPDPRRGLPARGPHAVGRRLPHRRRPGRAGGPRAAGRLPHACSFHGPDGDLSSSTPPGPSWSPPAWPSWPIPSDERYRRLVGTTVRTPLFGVEVPVHAHPLADPGEGHRHRHGLHLRRHHRRHVVARAATSRRAPSSAHRRPHREQPPDWIAATDGAGRRTYAELAGKTVKQAQVRIVALLGETGELAGEPAPIMHPVKFYERGDRPLEIVTTRQWYIRNGGRDADAARCAAGAGPGAAVAPALHAAPLRELGERSQRRLAHQPPALLRRAHSRCGTRSTPTATVVHDQPILPDEDVLPVDPSTDVPPGFDARQRGQPGGFVGDPDVMDTWATSSLTPQIGGQLGATTTTCSPRVFPMDLRPQAHEIIRTWLFSTVVRAHLEFDVAAVDRRRHLGLDPRPGPQEDVEVQGQRRHAHRPAGAVRRPTPCATGPPAAAPAPTPPSTTARCRSGASSPSSC